MDGGLWDAVDETNDNKGTITKEQADEIIDAFHIFDKNGDGVITEQEVGPVLRILGQNPTEEEIKKFLACADLNGKGHITRTEFVKVIRSYIKEQNEVIKELRDAFNHFDRHRTGHLDFRQLQRVLSIVGDPLSIDETKQFLEMADTNKDGVVDIEEFVAALTVKM